MVLTHSPRLGVQCGAPSVEGARPRKGYFRATVAALDCGPDVGCSTNRLRDMVCPKNAACLGWCRPTTSPAGHFPGGWPDELLGARIFRRCSRLPYFAFCRLLLTL